MKGVLIILFSCFVFAGVKAQVFTIGDMSCKYTPLNYTVNLSSTGYPTVYTFTKTYSFDVDGDMANDIKFDWFRDGITMGSSSYNQCQMKCTSPSNYELVHMSVTTCSGSAVVQNLPVSTPLNGGLNWALTPNSCLYTYCQGWLACNTVCGYYSPFAATTTVNIGFRKILVNDTIYGWVQLRTCIAGGNDEVVSYGATCNILATQIVKNNLEKLKISIFPNPNGGEFEIKGIKEETVFVTNELGQLITTKYLNRDNNYSVKLNDLQNGVYFIGNKFSRQKVVVIK